MVTPFRYMFSLALMLGIATPAWADSPVEPASCQAIGAKRIVVGRFVLKASDLNAFKQAYSFPTHPPGGKTNANARTAYRRATLAELVATIRRMPGNSTQRVGLPNIESHDAPWCGIVDEWQYAALAAYQQCNNSPGASNGNAYFKVDTSYGAFNDTLDHHARYNQVVNASHATGDILLAGDCDVCSTKRSAGTATTIPRSEIQVPTPVADDKTTSPRR